MASQVWTLPVFVVALFTSMILGAMHALSPGHGKTIVGAYPIGSQGTAKHALFLGLTVTAVHTAGVFALATLYASEHLMPERVYPWATLISGLLVSALGISSVEARLRAMGWGWPPVQARGERTHGRGPAVSSANLWAGSLHAHVGNNSANHVHLLPGRDGARVTWRSLLALGVSGGLLPCPSALVVMLGAIALQRVALGLLLVVAFSVGLASALTAVGLLTVYSARAFGQLRLAERVGASAASRLKTVGRALPIASAGLVSVAGVALVVQSLLQLYLPHLLVSVLLW